nr:MAG TPA: hypothetical protein [Caudoviricetes sp.]
MFHICPQNYEISPNRLGQEFSLSLSLNKKPLPLP